MYITFEVAGGNHPMRYSPFNIMQAVTVVGGDNYSNFSNTNSEHKLFIGRYESSSGAYLLGQQFTGRLSSGIGTIVKTGAGAVDANQDGRVYITGSAASGLPFTQDHLPGQYSGGGFVLVLSPNMATREQLVRVSLGEGHAISVSNKNRWAVGGSSKGSSLFTVAPVQTTAANATDNGWFAVYYQNGGNARLAVSEPIDVVNPAYGKAIQFSIFPNPSARQDIHILFQTEEEKIDSKIQLFDIHGKFVREVNSRSFDTTLPAKDIKPGLYIIKIQAVGVEKTRQLIIN